MPVVLAATTLGALGCSGSPGVLVVYISSSSNISEDPLDPSVVRWLRIRIDGPDMGVVTAEGPFERGGSTEVPPVPAGEERRLVIEGLTGEGGLIVSRGESLPFTISKGQKEIEVYVGLVDRFSSAAGFGLDPPRHSAAVVPLKGSGDVLFIGGRGCVGDDEALGRIERFDSTSARLVGPVECLEDDSCVMARRWDHLALPLADGALFAGGMDDDGPMSSYGLCNQDDCLLAEETGLSRIGGLVAENPSGGGYLLGGKVDGELSTRIDRIDASGDISEGVLLLPEAGGGLSATIDGAGGLLLMGFEDERARRISGDLEAGEEAVSHQILEDATDRKDASMVTLPDGRVLAIGGRGADGEIISSIEIFDPFLELTCNVGSLIRGRYSHGASKLRDGRVLVTGGFISTGSPTAETEMIDPRYLPQAASCERLQGRLEVRMAARLSTPRAGHAAISLQNGHLLVAGGKDEDGYAIGRLEIFVTAL